MSDTRENRIAFLLATSPHLTLVGDYTYKEAAKDFVSNGVTVQEWISVSERLPKNYISVNYSADTGHITHWMPLPELPKEA